jgi:hypothetical protein
VADFRVKAVVWRILRVVRPRKRDAGPLVLVLCAVDEPGDVRRAEPGGLG